jgi:hypothetical protein
MAIQAISSVSAANNLTSTLAVTNQPTSSTKATGGAPAGKASGGGGAHKAKAAVSSSSSSSSSSDTKIYDKMDTNKDGSVSAQEKAAYMLIHPEDIAKETESMNYSGQGNPIENQGGLSAILNLSA